MPTDRASVLDDRYRLDEVIGRGGMADVYRATDEVLGRAVAVKVLRETTGEPGEEDSARARFHDEARTLARLSHPHLTTVLDAGITGARPYLVMTLVEGRSLAACCAGTPLDQDRVAAIGAQLADGLAYAHSRDIVHRDVKPANVLLHGDRAVLTDFGIARLLSQTTRHTRTDAVIGSPAYLAPEQVRGQPVTPAIDVYSLGLVLLEALTGAPAYPGPSMEAALARLSAPPEVPPDLPADWRALLEDMTDLDPVRRPSAVEVARRLRALGEPDGATGSGADAPPEATQVLTAPPAASLASAPTGAAPHTVVDPGATVPTADPGDETQVLVRPREPGRGAAAWWTGLRAHAGDLAARARDGFGDRAHSRGVAGARRAQVVVIAVLVAAAVAMFTLALVSPDGSSTRGGTTPNDSGSRSEQGLPSGVPQDLREPLADLHRAVEGGDR